MTKGNGAATKMFAGFHCIDFSNPDTKQLAALVKQACLETGTFYVINHGISAEFMDEVFAQSKKFFDLPTSERMKFYWNAKYRGYQPTVQKAIEDLDSFRKDRRETYHLGIQLPKDDPDSENPFYSENVWPSADHLSGWKETMEKYHRHTIEVAKKVSKLTAIALDLNEDFFNHPQLLGKPIANLDCLHYGVQETDLSDEIQGNPPHCDFGLFTILGTDDKIGLQICRDKYSQPHKWEFVPPLRGSLIVTIGQTLERMTNDIFRATLHRVLFSEERYSIALFISPNPDYLVECLPTCKSTDEPAKYPPIKSGDFFTRRLIEVGSEKVRAETDLL